jgi:hypothetical protein
MVNFFRYEQNSGIKSVDYNQVSERALLMSE